MEEKNIAIFHSAFCHINSQSSCSHSRDDDWEIFEDAEEFLQSIKEKTYCLLNIPAHSEIAKKIDDTFELVKFEVSFNNMKIYKASSIILNEFRNIIACYMSSENKTTKQLRTDDEYYNIISDINTCEMNIWCHMLQKKNTTGNLEKRQFNRYIDSNLNFFESLGKDYVIITKVIEDLRQLIDEKKITAREAVRKVSYYVENDVLQSSKI